VTPTNTGTVTSVGLTSSNAFITVTGASPITTAGSYSLGIGTLPVANGGTGVNTSTGTGAVVLNLNPTFSTLNTGYVVGAAGAFNDLYLDSARLIFLRATNAVVIGSNNYPNTTGTNGQVLTTNGIGTLTWSSNVNLATITGSGTSGNLAITSAGAINVAADGWIYLNSNWNLGTAPIGSIRGFAFGWNNSGADGENILTYYTGAGSNPRLDICSWNGTTRTTRLTIDSSGALNTPTLKGSGTSGDLSLTSTRHIGLSTPTGTIYLNSNGFPSGNGTGGQVLTSNGGGLVVWRTPEKRQYGGYFGSNGANFSASTDTTYKGASSFGTTSLFTTGLSYNTSNGNWTNISASSLLVTATYSFNLTVAVGSGTCYYFTRLNGVVDAAQNLVGARDNATGTATFIVAPGNFFGFYARHTGFPCDFEPGSNIAITWTLV
jgi:hypothetical protein